MMHDHNDKGHGNMMWMMVICCAAPLLIIVFFGLGGEALGASSWGVIGLVAAMAIGHFLIMGRSHKHSGGGETTSRGEDKNKDDKDKKNHSGHECCH